MSPLVQQESADIRGKENAWMEVVVPCQLGVFMCKLEQNSTTSKQNAKAKEWIATTDNTLCNKRKPTPHKKTREMDAIYFKRRLHKNMHRHDSESYSVLIVQLI